MNADSCVIDNGDFFVRGWIEIPSLEKKNHPFGESGFHWAKRTEPLAEAR